MSVYKPPKSPYFQYDFVVARRRYHGSTGVESRRAAEGVERKKRLEAAAGTLGEASQMTLNIACGRWWKEVGKDKRSAPDLERRLALVANLIGPSTPIADITTARVSEAIEKRRAIPFSRSRKKGARKFLPSNSTANRDVIDTLRPVLRRARKAWGATGLPDIDWGELRLDEPKPKPKEFTEAEMALIMGAVRPHWHDMIRFGERYGARLGELFFPLADLDIADRDNARVKLRDRKGGDDHILPLLPEDAAWLAARLGRAKAAGLDTVWFRELKAGKLVALAYGGAESAVRRAMTSTGLRASKGAKGPHALRHNAGMKFLRATGNLRATQKLLGHASIQSTLVYAHAMEADVKAGLAAISRNSPEPNCADDENAVETKRSADG